MAYPQTPSQTVGPFFAMALTAARHGYDTDDIAGPTLAGTDALGERIRVMGRVLDHDGQPVDDALIELWQANAQGRYAHPRDTRSERPLDAEFTGFGRSDTGARPDHRFVFDTVRPGAPGGGQAPHLSLIVFMRGLLSHVYTRIYFGDEPDANAADPALADVPEARRDTLIATPRNAAGISVYHHDIHMGGDSETVFFDV